MLYTAEPQKRGVEAPAPDRVCVNVEKEHLFSVGGGGYWGKGRRPVVACFGRYTIAGFLIRCGGIPFLARERRGASIHTQKRGLTTSFLRTFYALFLFLDLFTAPWQGSF